MMYLNFDYWWNFIFSDRAIFIQFSLICLAFGIWLLMRK